MPITILNPNFNFKEAVRQLPASMQRSKSDLQKILSGVSGRWELVRDFIKTYNEITNTTRNGALLKDESLKGSSQSQTRVQNKLCKVLVDCVIFIPSFEISIEDAKNFIEDLLNENADSITRDIHTAQERMEDSQKIIKFRENSIQYFQDLENAIYKIKDDCVDVMLGLLEQQQRQCDLKILPEYFAALHNYIIKHNTFEQKQKSQKTLKLKKLQTRFQKLENLPWMSVSIPSISGCSHLGAFKHIEHFYLFVPECFSEFIKKISKISNHFQLLSVKKSLNTDEFQLFVLLQASFIIAEIKMILKKTKGTYETTLDKISFFLKVVTKIREHITNLQEKQKCISGAMDGFIYREIQPSLDQWLDQLYEYEASWLTGGLQELMAVIDEIPNDQRNV
jgi:hypothetical protein